jgi:hypothetical protein
MGAGELEAVKGDAGGSWALRGFSKTELDCKNQCYGRQDGFPNLE